jgi:hypothetical protein
MRSSIIPRMRAAFKLGCGILDIRPCAAAVSDK